MNEEVTHKQIYERLCAVEAKVDQLDKNTQAVDKAVWATYRQALRDITAQSGFPWTITWPVEPQ